MRGKAVGWQAAVFRHIATVLESNAPRVLLQRRALDLDLCLLLGCAQGSCRIQPLMSSCNRCYDLCYISPYWRLVAM